MKRTFFVFTFIILLTTLLSACAPAGHPNLLLLAHRLSDISEKEITVSDFIVTDGKYRLLFEKDGFSVLLTAEENEKKEIKSLHLSFSKIDVNGSQKAPTEAETAFFKDKICQALYAFTVSNDEKQIREAAEKILPLKSADFLKTGELTMDKENYHLVYYSNKICCRFTVTNTYLEKTELTEKPVSVPLYGVTAHTLAEN